MIRFYQGVDKEGKTKTGKIRKSMMILDFALIPFIHVSLPNTSNTSGINRAGPDTRNIFFWYWFYRYAMQLKGMSFTMVYIFQSRLKISS